MLAGGKQCPCSLTIKRRIVRRGAAGNSVDDYRVRTGWRNHPKRKKLIRKLGAEAAIALYDLWEFCAESRPDGGLESMSAEDIAIASGYNGDADEFVSVLSDLHLLDGEPGAYVVHDWAEHNPYAATSGQRSYSAKVASLLRWHNKGRHAGVTVPDCPQCASVQTAMRKVETAMRKVETAYAESKNRNAESKKPESPSSSSSSSSIPSSSTRQAQCGVPPIPLNGQHEPEEPSTWEIGQPIRTPRDFQQAASAFKWAVSVYEHIGVIKRILIVGQIEPYEIEQFREKAESKGDKVAYFLGAIEKSRKAQALEASKPPPPSARAPPKPDPLPPWAVNDLTGRGAR